MITLVSQAAAVVGERQACEALGVPRATYRRRKAPVHSHPTRPRSGGRALSQADSEAVLAELHEPRFADLAVPQVHTTLLEEQRPQVRATRPAHGCEQLQLGCEAKQPAPNIGHQPARTASAHRIEVVVEERPLDLLTQVGEFGRRRTLQLQRGEVTTRVADRRERIGEDRARLTVCGRV